MAANQIGFHLEDVNPLLIRFWSDLAPKRSQKVLVPLCGKSEDLIWLANQHDSVQGVELSQIAVRSFFAEHFYTPTVTRLNAQHELYQFDELTLFTGDFFTAPVESVDLVYDRAALVALPEEMRAEYAQRVLQLLKPGGAFCWSVWIMCKLSCQGRHFQFLKRKFEPCLWGVRCAEFTKIRA